MKLVKKIAAIGILSVAFLCAAVTMPIDNDEASAHWGGYRGYGYYGSYRPYYGGYYGGYNYPYYGGYYRPYYGGYYGSRCW